MVSGWYLSQLEFCTNRQISQKLPANFLRICYHLLAKVTSIYGSHFHTTILWWSGNYRVIKKSNIENNTSKHTKFNALLCNSNRLVNTYYFPFQISKLVKIQASKAQGPRNRNRPYCSNPTNPHLSSLNKSADCLKPTLFPPLILAGLSLPSRLKKKSYGKFSKCEFLPKTQISKTGVPTQTSKRKI